jgi:hypothetical protein
MPENRAKFIISETSQMHDLVTDIYEALMDKEHPDATKLLDQLGEKVRNIKEDLLTKEN